MRWASLFPPLILVDLSSRQTAGQTIPFAAALQHVHPVLGSPPRSRNGTGRVRPKREAEVDDMWSFVGAKENVRWRWHAIDHHTGKVLASVVGTRKDATFLELRALLAPCGITHYYTDKEGVYRRHLPPEQHTVGKLSMQKIERKPLTLRTRLKRLARKTLCFSRSYLMHDLLIGLYMNRVEFGCAHEKG
jgi:insertion element IS1 protein InsB